MTTEGDLAIARAAIATVPMLSRLGADAIKVTRLGGLTNLVFRIESGAGSYCLRVPGRGTDAYIDRRVEANNARAAAAAGVSPKCCISGTTASWSRAFLATASR